MEHHDFGKYTAFEVNEDCVCNHLVGDTGLGISRNLDDVIIGLRLSGRPDLDQPVGQPPGLNKFSLKRNPRFNVANTRKTKYRVAMMPNQPLAAFVVIVHLRDNELDQKAARLTSNCLDSTALRPIAEGV